MFVPGIVAATVGDGVLRAESCQGVDVRVGIVSGESAVFKPEKPGRAQQAAQTLLDGIPVEVRAAATQ